MSKSHSSPQFFSGLSQSVIPAEQTIPPNKQVLSPSSTSTPSFSSGLSTSLAVSAPEFSSGLAHSLDKPVLEIKRPIISQSWQIKSDELKRGKLLGKGSYGQVFLGEYHHEPVAIKIYDFRDKLPEKEQEEIFQEAKTMANLRSQFLVDFRGVTYIDQQYCLVMEYCENGTLRKHLDDTTLSVSVRDQLRWGYQISNGLYQLHSLRILHRDLKGENILLDKHCNAKIADFGLSIIKASSNSQSSHGLRSAAGTLPWMAPELFSGESQTPASDIYSLGMILWEIASRKKPFQGIVSHTIVGMVLAGTRQPLNDTWPSIFKKLITACWEANPSKRPSAKALGDEFEAALGSLDSLPSSVPEKKEIVPPSIQELLQLVVEGEQDRAELLIQKNPALLLKAETVTDLANRTFKQITAFEYAVWARDWHMWKMLLKYLPEEEATRQLLRLESKGTEHGRHFSFNPIVLAINTYVENAKTVWNYDHSAQYQWCKVIGQIQKTFPAFVVNEYCREDRSFVPQPDFKEEKLPRTRKLFSFSKEEDREWFTAKIALESKGFIIKNSFAFFRNNQQSARLIIKGPESEAVIYDLLALLTLDKTCHQELKNLHSQLLSKLPTYSTLSAIATASEQKERTDRSQYVEEMKKTGLLQNELVKACEQGDLKAVQAAVTKGASVSKSNSVGKQPLGAAIWGMNPEVVRYILIKSGDKATMSWPECERHNQQFYDNTFLFMDFNPKDIFDWHYLLEWMELSPFLQEKHVQRVEKSFAQDWQSLKTKVHDAIYDLYSEVTHDGQTASTTSVFLDFRTQIKKAVESANPSPQIQTPSEPATDFFKSKPAPKPAARQESKCLIS